MPFQGELKQAVAYNIVVDASVVSGKTAITIIKINKREQVQKAETFTVVAGQRTTLTDTAGPRIDRVLIQVHPPRGTAPSVEITQGTLSFVETCAGDTDLVFDAIA